MHPNAQLIQRFYDALHRHDAETMCACYAPDATFTDSVFLGLSGDQVRGMWRMLCHRGKDLTVTVSGIEADDRQGKAHWEARYTFSGTGKKVLNIIDAEFTFAEGKIIKHVDIFDLYKWSKQALGTKGLLLGWLPSVQEKIRAQARGNLDKFMSRG
jgi:ketosteroid isomerase-like protein